MNRRRSPETAWETVEGRYEGVGAAEEVGVEVPDDVEADSDSWKCELCISRMKLGGVFRWVYHF